MTDAAATTSSSNAEDDEIAMNPYLAMRAAKIARNEARLRELGLLKETNKYNTVAISATKAITRKRSRKVVESSSSSTEAVHKEPVILRRSRRLLDQPEKDYKELTGAEITTSSKRKVVPALPRATSHSTDVVVSKSRPAPPPPAANSVRSIDLDTKRLVIGDDGVLGLLMEKNGKEFVINESYERAAVESDKLRTEGYSRLSFNKYCGVQEWGNAIFLWVNLGDKGTVVNDFLHGGEQITWFGGSRMHDDSPVIHKLLRLGKEATTSSSTSSSSSSPSSNIILWCRKYLVEKKQFSPYMCLGRLAYQSHEPGSYPLSFVWTLLDYDALRNHSDKEVRLRFQSFTNT